MTDSADTFDMRDQRLPLFLVALLTLFILKGCTQDSGSTTNPASPDSGVFEQGIASWYGDDFQGKHTANGDIFDMHQLTAAHKTLQFGTMVDVKDVQTGRQVTVRINDRGPYVKDRIIDLSKQAASTLGILDAGTAEVTLTIEK